MPSPCKIPCTTTLLIFFLYRARSFASEIRFGGNKDPT